MSLNLFCVRIVLVYSWVRGHSIQAKVIDTVSRVPVALPCQFKATPLKEDLLYVTKFVLCPRSPCSKLSTYADKVFKRKS